jgi:hypothetical protein
VLQIENYTPFAADRAVLLDKDGGKVWVVVVKGTFRIEADGQCVLHEQQEPVVRVPQYTGQPGLSTLVRDNELVVDHPGTTLTLNASAYAPSGREAQTLTVGVEAGPITKYLHVSGDRWWVRSALRLSITDPAPFERMPITWERAFGGSGRSPDTVGQPYDRNPSGTGFAPAQDLEGTALPNIEYPHDVVRSVRSRPAPAGFSAVPGSWSPRRELAGTFDDEWLASRSPLWPQDCDPRHHLAAPADQVSPKPFRGGELVVLKNLTPDGLMRLQLPSVYFGFDTYLRRGRTSHRAQLDRVIIEPDDRKLVMVWRTALPCGSDSRAVEATMIETKRVIH